MESVNHWLVQQVRRDRRVRYLEDALLADDWWPYAWYRLRYFAARYLAATAVQSIKFLFLFYIFTRGTFLALIVATASASFATSFWWGALEHMRGRIRRLYRTGRSHLIAREVSGWLRVSGLVSLGLLGAGMGLTLGATLRSGGTFGLGHLYGLAIVIRLALEVVTRTLHSGIYAIRRVYRPLPAIVAVELAAFVPVALFWPVVGAWALPVGMIVASLTGAGLTVYYTLRMYRFLGIEPLGVGKRERRAIRRPSGGGLAEFLGAGLAYAVMKMDAFLILGLLITSRGVPGRPELFVLFFILAPTVQAAFDWAQLFYFDFKRLEIRLLELFRRRYEQYVVRLAFVLGVIFWVLACAIGTLVYQTNLGVLYALLAPFFVSRSLLAFVQIRMFSVGAYRALLYVALLLLAGFGAIALGVDDVSWKLAIVSGAMFGACVLLWRHRETGALAVGGSEPVSTPDWFALLRGVPGPVGVRWVGVSPVASAAGKRSRQGRERWTAEHLAARVARRLGRAGAVTVQPDGALAWFETTPLAARVTDRWLTRATAGAGLVFGESTTWPDGPTAARAARVLRLFGLAGGRAAGKPVAMSVEEVRRAFARHFPDGAVYSPEEPARQFLEKLGNHEPRGILGAACRFVRAGPGGGRRSPFDVTALCVAGHLRLIFVVDRRTARAKRLRWRTRLQRMNVGAEG